MDLLAIWSQKMSKPMSTGVKREMLMIMCSWVYIMRDLMLFVVLRHIYKMSLNGRDALIVQRKAEDC
jgi:hypothetical protein